MSAPALTRPTAPPRTADPNAGLPANALGKREGRRSSRSRSTCSSSCPFLALAAIVPAVWGWGLSWLDVGLVVGFYFLTLLGVTVGYHRHFTHGSFKAVRPLRVALAAIGGMAIQGPVVQWVADHRRHHAFADREGDPHSPWRYGDGRPRPDQGHVPRAPRLAVRPPADQRRALRPRPAEGHGRASSPAGCSSSGRSSASPCRPSSAGWSRRAGPAPGRRSSGPAWSASRCCTT